MSSQSICISYIYQIYYYTTINRTTADFKEDYEKLINNVKIKLETQAKQSQSTVNYSIHGFEVSINFDNQNILSKILKNSNSNLQKQKQKHESIVLQFKKKLILFFQLQL